MIDFALVIAVADELHIFAVRRGSPEMIIAEAFPLRLQKIVNLNFVVLGRVEGVNRVEGRRPDFYIRQKFCNVNIASHIPKLFVARLGHSVGVEVPERQMQYAMSDDVFPFACVEPIIFVQKNSPVALNNRRAVLAEDVILHLAQADIRPVEHFAENPVAVKKRVYPLVERRFENFFGGVEIFRHAQALLAKRGKSRTISMRNQFGKTFSSSSEMTICASS